MRPIMNYWKAILVQVHSDLAHDLVLHSDSNLIEFKIEVATLKTGVNCRPRHRAAQDPKSALKPVIAKCWLSTDVGALFRHAGGSEVSEVLQRSSRREDCVCQDGHNNRIGA